MIVFEVKRINLWIINDSSNSMTCTSLMCRWYSDWIKMKQPKRFEWKSNKKHIFFLLKLTIKGCIEWILKKEDKRLLHHLFFSTFWVIRSICFILIRYRTKIEFKTTRFWVLGLRLIVFWLFYMFFFLVRLTLIWIAAILGSAEKMTWRLETVWTIWLIY